MSTESPHTPDGLHVRAQEVLRAKKIWIAPLAVACIFVAVMAVVYIGSTVNPTGHLHDLPVMVVDEDSGAVDAGQHVNVGASLASALQQSSGVTTRLRLRPATLKQAQGEMDKGDAYATLIIPSTLTRTALLAAGVRTPGSPLPANAAVELDENSRLGTLGVNLADGVMTPAIAQISPQIGSHLSALSTPTARSNPILAARVANPITLTTATYRPLPDHSALGLSAFYIALLGLIAGFVSATLINSSVDTALGYSSSQMGPHFTQRAPVPINRQQTFLVKWAIAALAAPLLSGIVLSVAVALLGMYAPNLILLWGLLALAALMIATGTLALLATFGSIGQLLAMILLVYLSLASSGGTVPVQALPGTLRAIGSVEPLRNTLTGSRAILYFGARGDAGLTHSVIVLALEVLFWAAVGLGVSRWYDRKHLDRISPDLISFIHRTVDHAAVERATPQ
jgi:YhgE/Pip-like protein